MSNYRSRRTVTGSIVHYNDRGEVIGESIEGILPGTRLHYGKDGEYLGRTDEDMLPGSFTTRDASGDVLFRSNENWDGSVRHFGNDERLLGTTSPELFGSRTEFDHEGLFSDDMPDDFDF